jgi:hypothetical protein
VKQSGQAADGEGGAKAKGDGRTKGTGVVKQQTAKGEGVERWEELTSAAELVMETWRE